MRGSRRRCPRPSNDPRSRAILSRSVFPVWALAVATCVSALFRINFLKLLFDAEYGGIFRFSIGGRVLEISANRQSPGLSIFLFPLFRDVLNEIIRCKSLLFRENEFRVSLPCQVDEYSAW